MGIIRSLGYKASNLCTTRRTEIIYIEKSQNPLIVGHSTIPFCLAQQHYSIALIAKISCRGRHDVLSLARRLW